MQVKSEAGLIVQEKSFRVVKKVAKKGDKILKHNHPEALITFTVVKGRVSVYIDDAFVDELVPGKLLQFDGDQYINAEFLEDSEVFITIIIKQK